MATLRWSQDRVMLAFSREAQRRGARAAVTVEAQIKDRIAGPSPPASRPGQPPHRRTGALQRSVKVISRSFGFGVRVLVTVAAPYGVFLQRGTRRMAPRPFVGLPADARLIVDILSGRRR